jgi:hypothetical protein
LRRAKMAAWYLISAIDDQARETGFREALRSIDARIESFLKQADPAKARAFIVDFDDLRSAEIIDDRAALGFHDITIARAVAASANFPRSSRP